MDIKRLENLIKKAREAYYNTSETILSDEEYDAFCEELEKIDPNNPLIAGIGSSVSELSEWKKAEHEIPMGSLFKVNTTEEFCKWAKEKGENFVIEQKADGLSLSLKYKNGTLKEAITRGNGFCGEEIYNNVIKMQNVKIKLGNFTGSLRAEIMLTKDNFQKILQQGTIYKNPRNAASGISRRFDGKFCEYLHLTYYDILDENETCETEICKIDRLRYEFKLNIDTFIGVSSAKEVIAIFEKYKNHKREELLYEIDGLVIKIDNLQKQQELGVTDNRPKGQIAWKFEAEMKMTKLTSVSWSIGRTGHLTPVGHFKPVELAGTTVCNANLHNIDFIRDNNIGIGDEVLIKKAGDIIPKVIKVVNSANNPLPIIEYCPFCNQPTKRISAFLICQNKNCKEKIIKQIVHWCQTLDIKDVSYGTIKTLYEANKVKSIEDLYKITINDIRILEGFADRSAQIVIERINEKKEISLEALLTGISIPSVSIGTAEKLVEKFETLEHILTLTKKDIVGLSGFAEISADAVVYGLEQTKELIEKILQFVTIKKEKESNKLKGLSFCFTGKLNIDRKEAQVIVKKNGGSNKVSVVQGLSYLVTNDSDSSSSKNKKAKLLGVKIINEQQFWDLFK